MTDRVQPGAKGSRNVNIEAGESFGKFNQGYIVPPNAPTKSARRYDDIDETAFEGFDIEFSDDSLTVTVGPGEAFVDGWLARDESTEVELEDYEEDQRVVVGWEPDAVYNTTDHDDRNDADEIIIDIAQRVDDDIPVMEIWSFDTDVNGVEDDDEIRQVGAVSTAGGNIVNVEHGEESQLYIPERHAMAVPGPFQTDGKIIAKGRFHVK